MTHDMFCLDYSIDNRIVKVKWKKDFVDDPQNKISTQNFAGRLAKYKIIMYDKH